MSMIAPVEQLSPISSLGLGSDGKVENGGESIFGSIFQAAIDQVRETGARKVEAEYLLSTGQLDNPAALMLATSKSELSVSLLVQLRNKALDAYSELTRISL